MPEVPDRPAAVMFPPLSHTTGVAAADSWSMATSPAQRTRQFVLGLLCSAALIFGLGAALAPSASAGNVSGKFSGDSVDVVVHGDASYVPSLQRVSGMLAPPMIDGTAQVGQKLTASPGRWSQSGLDFEYQWLLDGEEVDDAVGQRFAVPSTALGAEVSVAVTVWGLRRPVEVVSDPVGPVIRGALPVKVKPRLVGTARVGATLTVSRPVTTPRARVSIRWFAAGERLDTSGMRLRVTRDLRGSKVRVEVTLRAPGYAPRRYGATTVRIR